MRRRHFKLPGIDGERYLAAMPALFLWQVLRLLEIVETDFHGTKFWRTNKGWFDHE